MRSPLRRNLLFCLLFAACGEAQHDFFDDGAAVSGTANGSETSSGGSAPATMTTTGSGGATATGGSGTTASDSGGSGVTATAGGPDASTTGGSGGAVSTGATSNSGGAVNTSGDAGSASTSTTANTSTTGADNDPECPDTEPEGTTRCNVTIGLTCNYGEVSCICSGLTWNCVGGDTTTGPGNGFIGGNGADGFGSGGTFSN